MLRVGTEEVFMRRDSSKVGKSVMAQVRRVGTF